MEMGIDCDLFKSCLRYFCGGVDMISHSADASSFVGLDGDDLRDPPPISADSLDECDGDRSIVQG